MKAKAFQLILDSDTIRLPDVRALLGKKVIVTIVEVPEPQPAVPRKWNFLGAVHLNQQLDNKNIRDLAYE